MQETTDAKNEEVDYMHRPKALVASVENWRRSSSHSSSTIASRRRSAERSSSWIDLRVGDEGWSVPVLEQSPEESGEQGAMKIDGKPGDYRRPTTRAGARNLWMKQGTLLIEEGRSVGAELGVGSSHDPHGVGDESTDLQLACGPSSSLGIGRVGSRERKDQAGKEVSDALDEGDALVMVPDSQRCDEHRRNGSAEAEPSQRRRTRLGKQIEIDESGDEGSRPETLLCLGTHPRFDSGTRSSGLGSSSRPSGPNGHVEPGYRPGSEGTLSKGKRKRDVDRSESAAAVGIALENAESESEDPGQSGPVLFGERWCIGSELRTTRRLLMGDLNSSSSRDRRRTADQEREPIFSLLDSPSRRRPLLRRNFSGVSYSIRPESQPVVLDPEEQDMRAQGDGVEEESHQCLSLSLEAPPPTTNPAGSSPARYQSAQIIDLISPEPEQLYVNRIIDLVSPERSLGQDSLSSNVASREEFAARRARVRRDRMRWTRNVRLRASTARQARPANGASSSQEFADLVALPANETEPFRRRAEPSQPYFLRSGPRSPWDDDVRVLEEVPVHHQSAGGSLRRRQRRFFPGADLPSSGGHPTIRALHHGPGGDLWPDITVSEDLFCHADNVLDLGESDEDDDRSRQLADDERIARQLQAAFVSEAAGGEIPDDETLARRLQAEEDSLARDFRHARSGDLFGLSAVQRYLGDLQSLRRESPPRFLRHARPRSETSAYSSSSSRFNFGPGPRNGRFVQLHRGQQDMDAELPGGRVQFPSHMTMESRLEVLQALENAIQEQVSVGLQLAQVDRDFNENDYEMLLALDTDLDRNRGASLEKIALLPLTTLQPTDVCEDTCSICLEMQVSGEVIRRLPCIHVFHMKCIDKWLQRQAVCPICKAHI